MSSISMVIVNKKINKIPINIIFDPNRCDYYLHYSFKSNDILTSFINKDLIPNDALLSMKHRFEKINFTGLNSLIEFCKNEKHQSLLLVLEWLNFFIYKVSINELGRTKVV